LHHLAVGGNIMAEEAENQKQHNTDASQNIAAPDNGLDELTKKDLDQVVGGSFQYYVSVKGTKQGQF
jgi:hypothetical protein